MPSIPLHPKPSSRTADNPLPHLLQTPSGLAILELQGTIQIPQPQSDEFEPEPAETANEANTNTNSPKPRTIETPIGKIVFPDYAPAGNGDGDDKKWMKRVYLYGGRYQRMAGEVKELAKPLAVIKRREKRGGKFDDGGAMDVDGADGGDDAEPQDELEIVDIVRYKLLFTNRPEPANDV